MAEVSFSFSLQYLATTSIFDPNIQEIFPPAEIELFCAPASFRDIKFKLPFKSDLDKKARVFAIKYESYPHHDSFGNINYDIHAIRLPYVSGINDLPREVTKYFNFKYQSEFQPYDKNKFTFGFPYMFGNQYEFGFNFRSFSAERRVTGSITYVDPITVDIDIDMTGVPAQTGTDTYTLVIDNGTRYLRYTGISITRPGTVTVESPLDSIITDTSGADIFSIRVPNADTINTFSVTLMDNQNQVFGSLISYGPVQYPVYLMGSEIKTRYAADSACCLTTVKCSPEEVESFKTPKSRDFPLGDRTTPPEDDEYLDPPSGGGPGGGGRNPAGGSEGSGADGAGSESNEGEEES